MRVPLGEAAELRLRPRIRTLARLRARLHCVYIYYIVVNCNSTEGLVIKIFYLFFLGVTNFFSSSSNRHVTEL